MDSYADDGAPFSAPTPQPDVFNPRLVKMRAAHAAELQDPNLRSFATRALLHEGPLNGLANNFEQLSNYANARGMGLRQALTSGFYGPVNKGTIQRGLSDDQAQAADAAIHSVFNLGRNKLAYRIDQGTVGDPNYNQEVSNPALRPAKIDGNFFSDHPSVGQGWAKQQLAADMAFAKEGGTIADQQYENGNPVAAINSSIHTPSGRGALSMASTDDDEEDTPALAKASGTGALFNQEPPNKLIGLGSMLSNVAASLASITNPAQARALREQASAFDQKMAGNMQYMLAPNGQLVRIDKNSGNVTSAAIPGASEDKWIPHWDKDGNFRGSFNPRTREFTGPPGGAAAQEQIGGDPLLSGQERYDSLTNDEKKTIDAWEAGTGIQPTGLALRNPKIAKLVDAANAIGIDMQKYGARQAMARELTKSGPSGAGGQLDSSSAMVGHVTDLANDYIKLRDLGQNTGFGATPINAIKNATTPAGSERDQLLKSIATHSNNFAGEVTKQLAGAPGGQEERNRRVNLVNQPNAAPATQAASLEAELRDAIAKRQATLDRVKDTMGEKYMAKNPRFAKEEAALEVAKQRLELLRNGPAIKDQPAAKQAAPKLDEGWTYLGTK